MGIQLAGQTLAFLYACVLGAALGLLYDVFRITRVAFSTGKAIVFAEDIVFFLICAGATFLYQMSVTYGQVRFFLLLGEMIGAVLYYFTLGQLVMSISRTLIDGIKRLLRFILRYLFRPVWRLVYWIVSVILKPFRFLAGKLKKSAVKAKFHLKVQRVVLYNQFTDYWGRRKKARAAEVEDEYGTDT